jgi:cytochrome c553
MRHLLITTVVSALLIGCSDNASGPAEPPVDLVAGKALADENCSACHGLDGRGTAPGIPHLAAQANLYLLDSLRAYKEGHRFHAALQDMTAHMSDDDLRNVVGYYSSLPPLEFKASDMAPENLSPPYKRGEESAYVCSTCHGPNGNSEIAGIPSLAGQQPLYFVSAVQAYLHGTRTMASMEATLRGLKKVDIENMALYYASQVPAQRGTPDIGDPAAGEPLSGQCGGCHGAHGVSHDSATPTLAGQDAEYLISATKAYRDKTRHHDIMLADSSDSDIADIAAFYSVQKSRPAEDGATSAKDLIEKCDRCHGPGIENDNVAIPKISGQDREYLARALRAYRDDRRESSMMHKMTLPYSDTLIETAATEYSNRPAQ